MTLLLSPMLFLTMHGLLSIDSIGVCTRRCGRLIAQAPLQGKAWPHHHQPEVESTLSCTVYCNRNSDSLQQPKGAFKQPLHTLEESLCPIFRTSLPRSIRSYKITLFKKVIKQREQYKQSAGADEAGVVIAGVLLISRSGLGDWSREHALEILSTGSLSRHSCTTRLLKHAGKGKKSPLSG